MSENEYFTHCFFSLFVPPYSIIGAIIAWSKDLVGKGLAMIALGFLGAFVVWPIIITIIVIATSHHH